MGINISICSNLCHEMVSTEPADGAVSLMNDIVSCSDRCHETMATDGACYIPMVCITMLFLLS